MTQFNLLIRNLNKEFTLTTRSQIANYILFDDKHALAFNNICKETKESVSMKALHCLITLLKDEALHITRNQNFKHYTLQEIPIIV
jgi:hypothetical protein